MREIIRAVYCDFCYEATDEKVPVEQTFTIGITAGEERPALYVAEVCAVHSKPFHDFLAQLNILQPFIVAKPPATQAKAAGEEVKSFKTPRAHCDICAEEMSVTGLSGHIWTHHAGKTMPPQPERCPDCTFKTKSGVGMSSHRRLNHEWSSVATAYAAAGHPVNQ